MAVIYGPTPQQSIFPKTISGLQLWLDANDKNTIFDNNIGGSLITTDGGLIGRWEDRSGNGRHALQSSSIIRPTLNLNIQNNLNCIRFDGTKYFSSIDTSSATSAFIICVFKIDDDPPTSSTFAGHPLGTSSDSNSHAPWVDGVIYDPTFTNTRKTTLNPTRSLTLFTMYSVESQANSWISKINSTEFFNTASNTFQNTSLFPNNVFFSLKGHIGEILCYSPIPSMFNIVSIQNYLNNKWRVY
jgi:hypothetical protein